MKSNYCKNLVQLTSVLLGHSRKDKLEQTREDRLGRSRRDKLEQMQLVDTAHGQVLLSELHIGPRTLMTEVQVGKQLDSVEEGKKPVRVEQHKELL